MKGVYACLLLDAVATPQVAPGVQIFLHSFADGNVFDLGLMTELDGAPGVRIREPLRQTIPVEYGQGALGVERTYHVDLNVVGIAVEHPVGEGPEIVGSEPF